VIRVDLSVMFFGVDDSAVEGGNVAAYDDILTIARTADRLGFTAVWTPERHFQNFGQVFPSPTVLSAAIAAVTTQIAVRAGSMVLPLHHPLRVVEDWAVVDNLSRGRVGLSVATGWHATDFVLAPGHYPDRKARARADIPLIRELWAGGAMALPDGTGTTVTVRPHPRPVSARLPLWMTSSGSEETWLAAGRLRTGVLAATVGQSRADLARKIELYRDAYRTAPEQPGTAEHGTVTLMCHTYVGDTDAAALSTVAEPLTAYLRSYLKQQQSNGGGDGRAAALTDAQLDQLAAFALRRYVQWGSLLGSPDTCRAGLADLADLGCDEVACFVDFGVGRDDLLAGLHRLADLRKDTQT
jgi:natural product biosynthesis luciferase-like monooxygenase protein